jgi:hypothetical protein
MHSFDVFIFKIPIRCIMNALVLNGLGSDKEIEGSIVLS